MIYYLTYMDCEELADLNLKLSPAADQKSKYISESIDSLALNYKIVELAETSNKFGFYKKRNIQYLNNGQIITLNGFGKPNRIFNKLHYYYTKIQLINFFKKLNKDDIVISYHSLSTAKIMWSFKHKINFKLILELEEKYQDVVSCSKRLAEWEDKVIACADAYILSAKCLTEYISPNKPYVICNGTYKSEPKRDIVKSNNTIHCVYAGTFDPTKGGVIAIESAKFLSNEYHMHILGFGDDEQVNYIKKLINKISPQTKCKITFEGLKTGDEYINFLQSCDIGLCTQIPDARYADTSFPSKILVYLANGLRVVSVDIPAIKNSKVGKLLHYYLHQNPEEIANVIKRIDLLEEYDSRKVLDSLNITFKEELVLLFNDLMEHFHE